MVKGSDRSRALTIGEMDRLSWRELAQVCIDTMVQAHFRKLAERRLAQRLPGMALGEQVSLARVAPRAVLPDLTGLGEAAVFEAVLGNPRLTFPDLTGFLRNPDLPPDLLRLVGEHHHWGEPVSIRTILVAHPSTPVHTALTLLATLPEKDVRRLLADRSLPPVVSIQAERICGGKTE